ncbi:MAG: hypothetical protein QW359_02840 [Metallosphaera sp.]
MRLTHYPYLKVNLIPRKAFSSKALGFGSYTTSLHWTTNVFGDKCKPEWKNLLGM